jgi:sporulation protein YlmC with PRC-barrel domain
MTRFLVLCLLSAWTMFVVAQPRETSVSALVGAPVQDLQGDELGVIDELILDVRDASLLYVVVGTGKQARTFPVRALSGSGVDGLRVDTRLASALAQQDSPTDPRFRRAGRLIGETVTHPGGEAIGRIEDIRVDLASGEIGEVIVATAEGRFSFPPGVLAQGHFPPLTGSQHDQQPSAGGDFVPQPSPERRSVQREEAWERR